MGTLLCKQYQAKCAEDFSKLDYETLVSLIDCDLPLAQEREIAKLVLAKEAALSDDFLQTLSDASREFIRVSPDAVKQIPAGMYCYSITSVEADDDLPVIKTKTCPHLETPKKPEAPHRCAFIGQSDEDLGLGLLWDGVKECGVKQYYLRE